MHTNARMHAASVLAVQVCVIMCRLAETLAGRASSAFGINFTSCRKTGCIFAEPPQVITRWHTVCPTSNRQYDSIQTLCYICFVFLLFRLLGADNSTMIADTMLLLRLIHNQFHPCILNSRSKLVDISKHN